MESWVVTIKERYDEYQRRRQLILDSLSSVRQDLLNVGIALDFKQIEGNNGRMAFSVSLLDQTSVLTDYAVFEKAGSEGDVPSIIKQWLAKTFLTYYSPLR